MSERSPRILYDRASQALDAAHKACFNHPDRGAVGMSHGPFSGVNVALGIIAGLEESNYHRGHEIDRLRTELERMREASTLLLSEIDASSDINAIVGASNPLRTALAGKAGEAAGENKK